MGSDLDADDWRQHPRRRDGPVPDASRALSDLDPAHAESRAHRSGGTLAGRIPQIDVGGRRQRISGEFRSHPQSRLRFKRKMAPTPRNGQVPASSIPRSVVMSQPMYRSQRLALRYFTAVIVLFGVMTAVGLLSAIYYIQPSLLYNVFDFQMAKILHINTLIIWLLMGFIGAVYWFLP